MADPLQEAVTALKRGDVAAARRAVEGVLAASPEDREALRISAVVEVAEDRLVAADVTVAQLSRTQNLTVRDYLGLAELLGQMGRYADASAMIDRAVDAYPQSAECHYARGMLLSLLADFPTAMEAFAAAARLAPQAREVQERIASLRQTMTRRDALKQTLAAISRRVVERTGGVVWSGPFRGMKYSGGDDFAGAAEAIGCYEEELWFAVEALVAMKPRTIVNIGASSGYYAVGFARRIAGAKVLAYELDAAKQERCRQVAEANGVSDRVVVRGLFTLPDFGQLPASREGDRVLMLCDCEGCEVDLLDPTRVPQLRDCLILCEFHDFLLPGLTPRLVRRFAGSHQITLIQVSERSSAAYRPLLGDMSPEDAAMAVSDFRPPAMQWAVMVPRSAAAISGASRKSQPPAE